MNRKQIKFEFTKEEIEFVKSIQRTGRIDMKAKETMKAIYQKNIDPNFNPCSGCNNAQKHAFKRLIQIMSESLGVKDLKNYVHKIEPLEIKKINKEVTKEQPKKNFIDKFKNIGKF